MAPKIEKHRLWCKKCKDWKLFTTKKLFDKEYFCEECKTQFEEILLKDIPEDKIKEQRERYKESIKKQNSMFSKGLMSGMAMGDISFGVQFGHNLCENSGYLDIIEHDAGQLEIDIETERKKREIASKKEEEIRLKREELKKFKDVNRNQLCICGSGKKYKKCCLLKHNKYYL